MKNIFGYILSFFLGMILTSVVFWDIESKFMPVLFVIIGMVAAVSIFEYAVSKMDKFYQFRIKDCE